MKRVAALVALCASAFCVGCPDYASLPYVDAGPAEGEGEGEGIDCAEPTSSTPWQRLDIDAQTETRAGALAADDELLYVALDDGRVRTMAANGAFDDHAECVDVDRRVEARRMFMLDDVLIISGRGGVCIVDKETGDHDLVVPGSVAQDVDVAAVPLDADGTNVVIMFPDNEIALYQFELRSRTATALSEPTAIVGDEAPVPALFIDAVPSPVGVFFADEIGRVYVVEPSAPTTVRRTADFGSQNPRGLVMAATADGLEVAHRDPSELFFFRLPYVQVLSGDIQPGLVEIDSSQEIKRPDELFPYRLDAVESVAVRADGARVDVGPFGFTAFTAAGADVAFPLGSEQRVANITAFGARDDASGLWAVSTNASDIIYWRRDTVLTGAWTTRVDASAVTTLSGLRNIIALGNDRAFIEAAGTLALASVVGNDMAVEFAVNLGDPGGVFDGLAGTVLDATGERAVAVNVGGVAFVIATNNVEFPAEVAGVIGNENTGTNFDLAVGIDPLVNGDDVVGIVAAGMFNGAPGVKRCTVSLSTETMSCGEAASLPIPNEAPHEFSNVTLTSAGLLVLTNRGAALEREGSFEPVVIGAELLQDFNGDGIADTPFAAGTGDVVDLGGGCLAMFGFSPFTFALDGNAAALSLDQLLPSSLNPFMTNATFANESAGVIVGSGGLGNVFYEIAVGSFADGVPCGDRFNLDADSVVVLPPDRPALGSERAAFFACDLVVADELGQLWRMALDP